MGLAHITLAVRNVRHSCDFFAETLGWKPISRPNNIAMPAAWLEIAPAQELHLIEVPDFEPSSFEREYGRHVAIAIPLAEFPAMKARLARRGAEIIPPLRETPFERFFFRAPDGYIFEIVAKSEE